MPPRLTCEAAVAIAVKALEEVADGELVIGEKIVGLIVPLASHSGLGQVCGDTGVER